MSDVERDLQALRREIAELREGLAQLRAVPPVPPVPAVPAVPSVPAIGAMPAMAPMPPIPPVPSAGGYQEREIPYFEEFERDLKRTGKPKGIGVCRITIAQHIDHFTNAGTTKNTYTDANLPSEADIVANLQAYAANPLTMKILYRLVKRYFEAEGMELPRAEIAQSFGVSETEVDDALLALMIKEVVQRKHSGNGEVYKISFPDPVLMLLLT
jgi:hypothetical protein